LHISRSKQSERNPNCLSSDRIKRGAFTANEFKGGILYQNLFLLHSFLLATAQTTSRQRQKKPNIEEMTRTTSVHNPTTQHKRDLKQNPIQQPNFNQRKKLRETYQVKYRLLASQPVSSISNPPFQRERESVREEVLTNLSKQATVRTKTTTLGSLNQSPASLFLHNPDFSLYSKICTQRERIQYFACSSTHKRKTKIMDHQQQPPITEAKLMRLLSKW
jgi:hypothetical protein